MINYGKYLKGMTGIPLKVIVYGKKGVNYIEIKYTFMLDYRKISQGEYYDALS